MVQKTEEVIVDKDVDSLEMTKFDILHHILMRYAGRYTEEEKNYLEKTTNSPLTLFDDDGKDDKYKTVSHILRLLKLWRKEKK